MKLSHHAILVAAVATVMNLALVNQAEAQFQFGRRNVSFARLANLKEVQAELKAAGPLGKNRREWLSKFSSDLEEKTQGITVGLSRQDRRDQRVSIREKTNKLNQAVAEDVFALLSREQGSRLREIMLQVQGPPALATDANLAEKLKITDDQKVKLAQIGQDYTAKMRELFQSVRDGGGAGGLRGKFTELGTKANEERLAILTDDQRAAFKKMQGKKLELDLTALRRRRSGR